MGWIGYDTEEKWIQFSREIDGKYVEGGLFKSSQVKANISNWRIVLDTQLIATGRTRTTHTRIRARFVNISGFTFKIHKNGLFSKIGRLFGMQNILIGDSIFDDKFIIKGNDEQKVKQLFSNKKIREMINAQSGIYLEITDEYGGSNILENNIAELKFSVDGEIKDVDRLKQLFELFEKLLNELCNMGMIDRINSKL
ncbi:DUF3137 domain-containing protein [Crassaminicella indica]|uniref:DUF3137 domain-containing protein n=1 Tax=Crassaminicella indica TaxID=2855394 RepID=A0ABX8R8L2_9CLOT|nr:DUF3137 domain-containing protein [Crassaminicella indica]QXM05141.1 DUF3137 domain-containing protein [Crassaminicella indica]